MNYRNVLLGVLGFSICSMQHGRAQETRTFKYLGDQTLQYRVYPGEKVRPAKTKGVQLGQLGSHSNDNPAGGTFLDYYVMLEFSYPTKVQSVVVEDVTDAKPMEVLKNEPTSAKVRKLQCKGVRFAATRAAMPWLWEDGDTWRVYRVTIQTDGKGTMVLLQPMRIDRIHKRMMRASMKELMATHQRKVDPVQERFQQAASKLMKGERGYILLALRNAPTPADVKYAVKESKHARSRKTPMVVMSLNRTWVDQMVIGLIDHGSMRTLRKIKLIVVAPDIDPAGFARLAETYGLKITVSDLKD